LRDRIKKIGEGGEHDEPKIARVVLSFITLGFYLIILIISTVIRGTLAAGIALLDTVIWVSVCFSEACPMVLSGLYEATLDRRVIGIIHDELEGRRKIAEDREAEKEKRKKEHEQFRKYRQKRLEERKKKTEKKEAPASGEQQKPSDGKGQNLKPGNNDPDAESLVGSTRSEDNRRDENELKQAALELRQRVHLLYAVIVGNLVQYPEHPKRRFASRDVTNTEKSLLDDALEHRSARHDIREQKSAWEDVRHLIEEEGKKTTQTRLITMLGCQASFGAAIGAPVVFFLGAFLFGVISNLSVAGDNDISHALAFGMWWMTIPHVAVVSGCLLAGNNPNTLEAIACGAIKDWSQKKPREQDPNIKEVSWAISVFRWVIALYRPFYTSVYRPVWMWERGRSKREWIRHVQKEHWNTVHPEIAREEKIKWNWINYIGTYLSRAKNTLLFSGRKQPTEDVEAQEAARKEDKFDLGFWDWIELLSINVVLLLIPFVLAFLTSYYTPAIGLSCRTFTFLLYFCFQILLSIIWAWDFPHEEPAPLTTLAEWVPIWHKRPTIYCLLRGFCMLGSLFTAVIGTFMQIVGVYRNCLCDIPMSHWGSRNFMFAISTNSDEDIHYARDYWVHTGIASIVLLIVVCYVGWWYQRHWRYNFTSILNILLHESPKQVEPTIPVQSEKDVQPVVTKADSDEIKPLPSQSVE
jgi:hypothetical protein